MKEKIKMINSIAQENFDKAQGMLEMLNSIYGTNYAFLARRVVFSDYSGTAEENTAQYYAYCHDLYCYL